MTRWRSMAHSWDSSSRIAASRPGLHLGTWRVAPGAPGCSHSWPPGSGPPIAGGGQRGSTSSGLQMGELSVHLQPGSGSPQGTACAGSLLRVTTARFGTSFYDPDQIHGKELAYIPSLYARLSGRSPLFMARRTSNFTSASPLAHWRTMGLHYSCLRRQNVAQYRTDQPDAGREGGRRAILA